MLNESKPVPSPLLTDEQLAHLGGGRVAYVKPLLSEDIGRLFPQVPPIAPGQQFFALLNADGTPIVLTNSRDAAIANALEHELLMVSLH